jgi:hypothetical protein
MTDSDTHDTSDEALLRSLGDALRAADPVPERVTNGAKAAFTWRSIDVELAQIEFDSAVDLAGVRGHDDRQITFRAPGVEIEIMMMETGSRRLVGQLVPPGEMSVELVESDGVRTTGSDRLGRFGFDDVALGPIRLSVVDDDGRRIVQTEWVVI